MGELAGRTVLVTGAGRGIGRAEALYLAAAGANVVVNDPGVDIDGRGGDQGVAAAVVDEIRGRGGQAVADTGSVADWAGAQRMVELAVAEFGDLHAVVNNATIEVNKGLERLTEAEFDDVVAVKLKGSFATVRNPPLPHPATRAAGGRRPGGGNLPARRGRVCRKAGATYRRRSYLVQRLLRERGSGTA